MEYDARSRLVKETDSYGTVTLYGYDNANRLTSVTDGEGNTTTYEYDNLGELIAVTDANGAVITYEYDSLGRRISETDGMGRLHTWEYDTAGNLAAEVSAAGIRTCYTYDAQDFLIRTVRYPAGWEDGSTEPTETTVYTRDSAGRLTAVTNVDGTVHYVYDGLGRLISVTDCSGDTLSYTYDEYGRKSSVTARGEDEGYGSTVYEYDKYGRMTKVSDSYGNTIVYFYNVDGTLNRESRNNGLTTVYEYDVCGFVKKIKTIDAAEHCVTEYNYVTGTNGEVLEIHETAVNAEGEQEEKTTLYGYDSLNRLVSEMIRNTAGAVTFSYGYDAVSNRVSQTVRFEGDVERLLDSEAKEELREGSITYTYNERNQLVKEQLETTDGNFDEDTGENEPFFNGAFHADDEMFGSFSCSDLKFRSLHNNICSYFELGFEKCKEDIIKRMVLGPKCQIEEKDMKILLRKYMYIRDVGLNNIKIQKSKIPYV